MARSHGRAGGLVQMIRRAYGSLEEPHYGFMEAKYSRLRRHVLIGELMSAYFVRDETDLNDHAALHLHVLHAEGALEVCLSFVDRLAMVFRLEAESAVYAAVVDGVTRAEHAAEQDVLERLARHGFRVLSREEAATPIAMELFNTDRHEARVYHAVISDDGVIPEVLRP